MIICYAVYGLTDLKLTSNVGVLDLDRYLELVSESRYLRTRETD